MPDEKDEPGLNWRNVNSSSNGWLNMKSDGRKPFFLWNSGYSWISPPSQFESVWLLSRLAQILIGKIVPWLSLWLVRCFASFACVRRDTYITLSTCLITFAVMHHALNMDRSVNRITTSVPLLYDAKINTTKLNPSRFLNPSIERISSHGEIGLILKTWYWFDIGPCLLDIL